MLAIAAIDDERLVAQAARDPRRVHRGVARAVDRHPPPQPGQFARADPLEEGHRVEDLARVAAGDLGALGQVRADGQKHGVEVTRGLLGQQILDFATEQDPDPHLLDAADLLGEHVAGQPVGGDPEHHHASRHRTGLVDLDGVPEARQVIPGAEPARACPHHQDPLAARLRGQRWLPTLGTRAIAQKSLDRVDTHR